MPAKSKGGVAVHLDPVLFDGIPAIFSVKDAGSLSLEVRVQDSDVWLTLKAIPMLFDVDGVVVTKHLKNLSI